MRKPISTKIGKGVVAVALAASLGTMGVGTAFAATQPFGSTPDGAASTPSSLLTTYGVRAGSAGADFVGVTNTNYDFTSGLASATEQYTGYTSATEAQLAGLTIWGSSVNEYANPYYANLLYHAVTGNAASGDEATTWMKNDTERSSWGDSFGADVTRADGTSTINGLEYSPDIIFGASKVTNWNLSSNGSNSDTYIYDWLNDNGESARFVNNDATNLWTQIYTMGNLAQVATGMSGTTRYDSEESALDYEYVTKGQMLYIASQIDTNQVAKKTVAYLYAIDASGTAYFFVPTASGLLSGDDTNAADGNSVTNPDDNYAANNSTINMGYMATLPFITDTFNSGTAVSGGIVMKVEDIYKSNPACTVSDSDSTALADVDVIIYNTTKNTDLDGTSGGKNSSSINNDYYSADTDGTILNDTRVLEWAKAHGYEGAEDGIIGGDDFGTSTNQTGTDTAPTLYCQRNYTADKNARAAWAFAKVYPELYNNNSDATYCYWVDAVYHVGSYANVRTVAAYMTNQTDTGVSYSPSDANRVVSNAQAGYTWWMTSGKNSSTWSQFAYYNGSSRASYYSGTAAAEEGSNVIGIFAPSGLWTSANGQ